MIIYHYLPFKTVRNQKYGKKVMLFPYLPTHCGLEPNLKT